MWNATSDIFNALPDKRIHPHPRCMLRTTRAISSSSSTRCWPAKDGSFEIGDLIPQTASDIPEMCRRITELLGSIQNRHLAALVQAYLDDQELMGQFSKIPAAMSFYHAFLGGLLEDTLNAIEVADAIVKFYPGLNRDLVLAWIFRTTSPRPGNFVTTAPSATAMAGNSSGISLKPRSGSSTRPRSPKRRSAKKSPSL